MFEENSVKKITWLSWRNLFQKAPFSRLWTLPEKADIIDLITHLVSFLLEAILCFQLFLRWQWRFEAVFHHQGYIKKLSDFTCKMKTTPSYSLDTVLQSFSSQYKYNDFEITDTEGLRVRNGRGTYMYDSSLNRLWK